jgi:hypothetical protein
VRGLFGGGAAEEEEEEEEEEEAGIFIGEMRSEDD